ALEAAGRSGGKNCVPSPAGSIGGCGALRRRALRPQLKRDPLGGEPYMAKRISRRLTPLLLAVLTLGCARGGSSSPSGSSHQDSTGQDTTLFQVVPGQRFGAVTDTVTHADLARLFGAANVHEASVQCDEGSCNEPGTVVNVP